MYPIVQYSFDIMLSLPSTVLSCCHGVGWFILQLDVKPDKAGGKKPQDCSSSSKCRYMLQRLDMQRIKGGYICVSLVWLLHARAKTITQATNSVHYRLLC